MLRLMETVHAEDPNWQADHELSWDELSNIREIGKVRPPPVCSVRGSVIQQLEDLLYAVHFATFALII